MPLVVGRRGFVVEAMTLSETPEAPTPSDRHRLLYRYPRSVWFLLLKSGERLVA